MGQINRFKDSYEVIVAGAGIAGLSAALNLAREGVSVLLLEQHNMTGGYATSFVRGRYEFELVLRAFAEMGDGKNGRTYGDVREILDENGIHPDLLEVPECYRVMFSRLGVDAVVPWGVEEGIAAMEKQEPGSGPKMRNFVRLCEEIYEALMYIASCDMKPAPLQMATKYHAILRTSAYSVEEIYNALGFSEKMKSLLSIAAVGISRRLDAMNFTIWALMIYMYMRDGAYIVNKTSHSLAVDMEKRIRELGGQVETNVRVERLLTEGGTVVGVKTGDGSEIRARRVICNFAPNTVYDRMMDRKDVPERALKLTGARTFGASIYNLFLGLDALPAEMGITNYAYLIGEDYDTRRIYKESKEWKPPTMASICCPDVIHPGFTGPDRCQLSFTSLYDPDAMRGHTDPLHYMEDKEKFANAFIDLFESRTGAKIRDHVEEIEIVSPASYARYSSTPLGNIYGYEVSPVDGAVLRTLLVEEEQYIPGLDFVGTYGRRCHSFGCGIVNGLEVTKDTLKKLGKEKK